MKKLRKATSLFLALVLGLFSFFRAPIPIEAASPRDVITELTVVDSQGRSVTDIPSIGAWSNLTVNGKFVIPNDGTVKNGDQTIIEIPEHMRLTSTGVIDVKDENGIVFGTMAFESGTGSRKITLTYNDKVETLSNVKGFFRFTMAVNHFGYINPVLIPQNFNVDFGGSNRIVGFGNLNYIGVPRPNPVKFYKNGYFNDEGKNLGYTIVINQNDPANAAAMPGVVYYDETRIPGTIDRITIKYGEWFVNGNNAYELREERRVSVDPTTVVVKEADGRQHFTLNIGDIAQGKGVEINYGIRLDTKAEHMDVYENTGKLTDHTGYVKSQTEVETYVEAAAGAQGENFKIVIKKVNEQGAGLENAKFEVYQKTTGRKVGEITTDQTGHGELGGLLLREYFLREVEAPNGYKRLTDDIPVPLVEFDSGTKTATKEIRNERNEPSPIQASFTAKKVLEGRALADQEFEFVLKDQGGQELERVKNDATGLITFSPRTFTAPGDYVFKIEEVNAGAPGITYAAPITVTVKVTKDDTTNTLSAVVQETEEQRTFKNKYTPATPVEATIKATKELVGKNLKADTYQFELVDVATGHVVETVTNTADGKITFSPLQYDESKVGVHKYLLREVVGSEVGITYHRTPFEVEVKVEKVDATTLKATVSKSAEDLKFTNVYTPAGSTVAVIEAKKVLEGQTLEAGKYEFELVDAATDTVVEKVANDVDGNIKFSPITYDEDKVGVHKYKVREVAGSEVGITYDTTIFEVEVDVQKVNATTLKATVSKSAADMTFKNKYTPAADTTAVIKAFKYLEGKALEAGKYEFELVDVATGTVVEKVANDVDGNITFSPLTYNEGQVGVHKYQVREVAGTEPGVTYDATVFDVEVEVKKVNATTLTATVSKTATDLTFKNKYVPAGTTVDVTANKVLTGRALNADEFVFILKDENGVEVARAKNAADGTILFAGLAFDKAGVFNYTVEEVAGDKGGVTYEAVSKPVVITVTDDGSGQLAATMTSEPAQFNNTYKPAPVDVRVKLTKELTGRGLNEGEFEFILKDEAGNEIERAKNAVDGSVTFNALTFDTVGVYNYTVEEVDNGLGGVTYDTEPKAFTVTVTDDLEGKLVATVNPESIIVKNSYKPAPVPFGFKGTKELVGRKLTGGEFEFVLKDVAGNEVARTVNTGSGEIKFDGLFVSEPGTYKFTIEEVNNGIGGVTYDASVKEVEVTVTDNGKGQLVAKVKGNKFVFKNGYEANGVIVEFTLKKELVGRELKDGEFEFILKDKDGKELSRSKNNAKGEINFKLEYAKAGTYRYTVEEVKGKDKKVVYDESVKEIEVTVTDDGKGQLDAVAKLVAGGTTFTNSLVPPTPPTPKAVLPKTGEAASAGLVAIGLVMMLGTAVFFRRKA